MPVLGITGKPNVGKSTFFSAATLSTVPVANYPFTTRTPNVGITYVRTPCVCTEFGVKDNPVNSICVSGTRLVPVRLIDCPGLVPGAWQGRGLGNRFLDEVRKADALLLLIDASGSTDIEGRPVAPGAHDPVEDVRFLEQELDMWITQILRKDWERLSRRVETTRENLAAALGEKLAGLQISKQHVHQALVELDLTGKKPTAWSESDLQVFSGRLRRIAKAMLIVANKVDVQQAEENLPRLRELGYPVIPASAEAELLLRLAADKELISYVPGEADFALLKPEALSEKQKAALHSVRERVLTRYGSTGIQNSLNFAFFQLLQMIPVFPVEDAERLTDHKGNVLPDCYLVKSGTTARELAGLIHTELAETFIYAVDVRAKRRLGEDYALQPRDVIRIVASRHRG